MASGNGLGRRGWLVAGVLLFLILGLLLGVWMVLGVVLALLAGVAMTAAWRQEKARKAPRKAQAAPTSTVAKRVGGAVADAALGIAVHDPDVYVQPIEGSMLKLVASVALDREGGLELDPDAFVRFGVLMGGGLQDQEQRVQGELRSIMAAIMVERDLDQTRYKVRGPFVTENERGAKFYWVAAVRK